MKGKKGRGRNGTTTAWEAAGGGGGGGGEDEDGHERVTCCELPEEVWVGVFAHLDDGADLCAVAGVCRAWHRLALDDALWKGLAIKRGWTLPAMTNVLPSAQSSGKITTKRGVTSRGKAKSKRYDSGLTKGRPLDDDDEESQENNTGVNNAADGQLHQTWKEWYVHTLHRRVKRSMRECEYEDDYDEQRWQRSLDGEDGCEDIPRRKGKEKLNEDEVTDQAPVLRPQPVSPPQVRDDFIKRLKEKAERSLVKVENREQEVVLAQFAWDTQTQLHQASEDDLYLVGGTPWGLVNYMLTEISPDDSMVSQFLLTHQSFMPSAQVLRMLQDYLTIMPRSYSRDYQLLWRKHKLRAVQNMIIHVLKLWIREQPHHFRNDPALATLMLEFLDSHTAFSPLEKEFLKLKQKFISCLKLESPRKVVIVPRMHRTSQQRNNVVEHAEANDDSNNQQHAAEDIQAEARSVIDMHKISSKKLARQMALLAYSLFDQLPVDELLDMRWKREPEHCPNAKHLINYFNMIAGYVATTVVIEKGMKQRVRLIEKWIEVANHSFKIQDLTSTLAVVSGLGCAAIHRLKRTQQALSKSSVKLLQTLTKVSGRRRLRELVSTLSPPAVPYLGVHLIDLSFVSDGYTKYLNLSWGAPGDQECVHWYYHCMNALAIQEMQALLGHSGFSFKRDPALINALCSLPYLSFDDAYRRSLTIDETQD